MSIKDWFAEKYGSDVKGVEKMARQIGYVESKNVPTAIQKASGGGTGPGRGLFQFETKGGSGAFQTALNRAESLYRDIGEEVPSWIAGARKHDDASQLSSSQQQELLLGDLAMKQVRETPGLGDELIRGALKSGSAKDLWLQAHWAGAEEGTSDYSKKASQWDREMETYGVDLAMVGMKKYE